MRSRVRVQLLLMVFFSVVQSATCPWLVNRQLFSCMATVSSDFDYVSERWLAGFSDKFLIFIVQLLISPYFVFVTAFDRRVKFVQSCYFC